MNKKLSFILLAVLFVLLIAAAVVGYNSLTESDTAVTVPSGLEFPSTETSASPAADTEPAAQDSETSAETAVNAAPDFTVYDMDGNAVKLSDYIGKPTIVNFWATWCNPCLREMPYFDKFYGEYSDRVNFLMVNLTDGQRDTVETVKAYIEEHDYSFPVFCDTNLSASSIYSVYSVPMTFFINSDGSLAGYQLGSMSEETLYSYINQLIEINS
ncbi:MAG: TlpA family protein disulfide reductase [Clostridia bacterium]|nr:TlpA family protein disulfide reductase [Clostridia bacterium]